MLAGEDDARTDGQDVEDDVGRASSHRPVARVAISGAIIITAVLVYLAIRVVRSSAQNDDASSQAAARPAGLIDTQDPLVSRLRSELDAPSADVPSADVPVYNSQREALELEREALRAQLRAEMLSFNKKASALKEYDPLLCAHMDHPLCPAYAISEMELARLADCGGVKLDTPRFMWNEDEPLFDPRWESVGLTPDERTRVERKVAELRDDFETQARKAWAAETGDEADAAALDLAGLNFLLFRGPDRPSGFDDALRHVSAELAGRSTTDAAPPHVVEYLRTMAEAGDHLESALAEAVGASKAAKLRRAAAGWGHTQITHAGCPEDDASRSARERIAEIDAELEGASN